MIVRGNLIWKDGIADSEVIFEPSENGRFYIETTESKND